MLALATALVAIALTPSPSDGSISSALAAFAGTGSAVQRLARSGTVPTSNYIRLRRARNTIEVQTATVSLSFVDEARGGKPFELGLVSTVHLAEPPYYAELQAEADGVGEGAARSGGYDRVLFELLADEGSVESDASGARRLREPLMPAPSLQSLAASNRLTTQVGALDCMHDPRWVLADVSRAELAEKQADADFGAVYADAKWRSQFIAPLRNLLASGPPNRANSLSLFRLVLCVLPAPEAALLLDDWLASRGAAVSPALQALFVALGRLDFDAASRLSFAQTLASGETTQVHPSPLSANDHPSCPLAATRPLSPLILAIA